MDSQPTARSEDLQTRFAELHQQIHREARQENWVQVAQLTKRRDALLDSSPYASRARLLQAAISCNEMILDCAIQARRTAAERLAEFKHGRASTSRYVANGQLSA